MVEFMAKDLKGRKGLFPIVFPDMKRVPRKEYPKLYCPHCGHGPVHIHSAARSMVAVHELAKRKGKDSATRPEFVEFDYIATCNKCTAVTECNIKLGTMVEHPDDA